MKQEDRDSQRGSAGSKMEKRATMESESSSEDSFDFDKEQEIDEVNQDLLLGKESK